MQRVVAGFLWVIALAIVGTVLYTRVVDRYQREGTLQLKVLSAPVRVVRDGQGIPYIFAQSLDDAIRAQGWVTAQDRGFQLEFERYLSSGRLAELVGESALAADIELRLAGTRRHGERQAAMLAPADRRFYELYLEGVNAYVAKQGHERQFGFGLLGIAPQPWTVADVMTLQLFLSWQSAANLQAELVAQELSDRLGPARAAELAQVTINPDDGGTAGLEPPPAAASVAALPLDLQADAAWFGAGQKPLELGSNQWVTSGSRSVSGAPVLVNDPHLDARTLPGIWHPVGLITPDFRAVGAAGPGIPGIAVGRTSHVAFGVTNAYADVVDLFIETEDPARPGHYLEGGQSYPFAIIDETVRVRKRPGSSEFREVPLRIRLTHRGPVISDHGMGVAAGTVLAMRWSAPEAMQADTGAWALFTARDVTAARRAIGRSTAPFNYVIADTAGNIGHATGGRVPVRRSGDGSRPVPVTDGTDAWDGFVPWDAMPGQVNPSRGWVGNANHRTVSRDFPTPYSTYFAASWRYRRMLELLESKAKFTPEDHWAFMRDTKNMMAANIAPLMSAALTAHPDTREAGAVLAAWDHTDAPGAAAPAIFQSVYRHFARRVLEDDLGEDLAARYLGSYYLWHERLALLLEEPDSDWFDDRRTPGRETRDELFHRAGQDALAELRPVLGDDVRGWEWGKVHTVTFFSPLVPGAAAAGILGGGVHPKEGSGETLNRATFKFDKPYAATSIASMRVVADLGDRDRIMAVLTGGASGRQFDPHLKDQTQAWLDGEPRYWWFSDAAIAEHAESELTLIP
ncbi:MAG: penicillin acylase family protein [Gammaproteobacteria bacterium]|nr:penicillin acylase family protein [Gammaproteobacteria bacterium]